MPDEPAPANPMLVSTRNAHKVSEIRAILGPGFDVRDLSELPDMPGVEETGTTFEENAAIKALAASPLFDGWVIADDSGLEVDALGGAPGVLSARYAGPDADDSANNALLLKNLCPFSGRKRAARFRCVIALARGGKIFAFFSGAVEGVILRSPRGQSGFGYDPLFLADGTRATFAELDSKSKNAISHRSRALAHLKSWPQWNENFSCIRSAGIIKAQPL